MADNIAVTAGSGTTIATDQVGTVHYQKVKLIDGTADSEAAIGGDASNGLDVDVTRLPALVAGNANIGDVDVASLPSGNIGQQAMAASVSTVPANNITDATYIGDIKFGEALPAGTAVIGDLVSVKTPSKFVSLAAVDTVSIATVWTPGTGKKFRLMGGTISTSTAISVLFEDNSAGAGNFVYRTPVLVANTPYNFDLGNGVLSAAANNVLKATGSAAGTVTGTLYGIEE